MGFAYKICPETQVQTPSTIYTDVTPAGWNFTFNTIKNGVYEINIYTQHAAYADYTDVSELDFVVRIDSGGTILADSGSLMVGTHGMARSLHAIVQADSSSISMHIACRSASSNVQVKIFSGFFEAKRVA